LTDKWQDQNQNIALSQSRSFIKRVKLKQKERKLPREFAKDFADRKILLSLELDFVKPSW